MQDRNENICDKCGLRSFTAADLIREFIKIQRVSLSKMGLYVSPYSTGAQSEIVDETLPLTSVEKEDFKKKGRYFP